MSTLGYLCWYTVPEDPEYLYDTKKFHQAIFKCFADTDVFPSPPGFPQAHDVFKRACNKAQRTVMFDTGQLDYKIMGTGTDTKKTWRTLVRRPHGLGNSGIPHKKDVALATVTMDRLTEEITWELTFEGTEDEYTIPILTQVAKNAAEWSSLTNAYAAGEFIRGFIEQELLGVKVRQGVYFVPTTKKVIGALDNMLRQVDLYFHYVPLPEDPYQKELVRKGITRHIHQLAGGILDPAQKILVDGSSLSNDRFKSWFRVHKELAEKWVVYENLVGGLQDEGEILKYMNDLLLELMTRVKV
jgi:hypothetical protein